MQKSSILFFLLILYSNVIFAQVNPAISFDNEPLNVVLKSLRKEFKISISFNSKITTNKSITYQGELNDIQHIFDEIQKQTGLLFTKISLDNYVLKDPSLHNSDIICGYIFNARNQKKIANVSIIETISKKQIYTDSTGFFQFEKPKTTAFLEITSLGYKTNKIPVSTFESKNCIHIFLEENPYILDEVLIENYLNNGYSKNKDGSIIAIPNKMEILPGILDADVLQSLQFIPGIQSPDETATGINIRGGTSDQNLILYDGIKMYHYDHFFGMLSSFNPYIINQVKLFKNGGSARYRNHLSGIVDIISDIKIPEKIKTGIGTNMIYGDIYLKMPISKDIGLFFSARRSFSDFLETITFDEFSEQIFQNTKITDNNQVFSDVLSKTNNTFYFTDFTAKLITNLNTKNTLIVSSIFFKNKLDFRSQFEEIDQRTRDQLNITNKGLGVNWKASWNTKLETKVNFNYTNYNYNYKGEELQSDFFDYETIKKNIVSDLSFDFFSAYKIHQKHKLVNGYRLTQNDLEYTIGDQSDVIFDENFLIESKQSKNITHTVYNEYYFNSDKWKINSGIRTDYFTSLSKIFLQPNLHVMRRINDLYAVHLTAEKQYQAISQIIEFETKRFGLENQVWTLADAIEIPVIESSQISIGANYKNHDLYIDAEVYHKKIKNITSITKGFNRDIDEFSIGESSINGLEVLLKKRFNHFSSIASYSLTQNMFRFDDLNEGNVFSGNFDIRHYLTLIQSYKLKNLEISLGWKYRTPRPYTPASGISGNNADDITIDYGEINSKRLTDYHRLDLSFNYKIKPFKNTSTQATFGFSLLNIYNRKSILNRSYRIILNTNEASFQLRETNKFSLGRVPNFTFHLDF